MDPRRDRLPFPYLAVPVRIRAKGLRSDGPRLVAEVAATLLSRHADTGRAERLLPRPAAQPHDHEPAPASRASAADSPVAARESRDGIEVGGRGQRRGFDTVQARPFQCTTGRAVSPAARGPCGRRTTCNSAPSASASAAISGSSGRTWLAREEPPNAGRVAVDARLASSAFDMPRSTLRESSSRITASVWASSRAVRSYAERNSGSCNPVRSTTVMQAHVEHSASPP